VTEDSFENLLSALHDAEVEFILVGGLAAMAMGSARATFDVDVVYSRGESNIRKLVDCLAPHHPYLRGAPPGLPFAFDRDTVARGLNFTLTTSLGDLDLLGEVVGGGTYEALLEDTTQIEIFGVVCRCVTLERLIQLKRAAGRPKDLEVIAELVALLEERRKRSG
jgi:predicted nucleotidyltransferase